jgi:N-acetylneuraminic acid mutarotase
MIVLRLLWRVVKILLGLIAGVVAIAAIAILVLKATNPKPEDREGWALGATMGEARGESASAMYGDRLIVIGGLRGIGTTSDTVSVYDIENDRWARADPVPEPIHHAAAATAKGNVFVSGGAHSATNWRASGVVSRLRPGQGWSEETRMPEGRQGHAMVAIGDKLYVVGGVGVTDRTLIYDIGDGEWTLGAELPEGRDHLRAVVLDKKIWALGGRSGKPTGRVDVYDPKKDEWSPGPALPEPMSAMAAGVVGDVIHVVGSEDPTFIGGGVSSAHHVLREKSDEWERLGTQPLGVHGAAFGVYNDTLVVAGGASRNGALSVLSWTNITQAFTAEEPN